MILFVLLIFYYLFFIGKSIMVPHESKSFIHEYNNILNDTGNGLLNIAEIEVRKRDSIFFVVELKKLLNTLIFMNKIDEKYPNALSTEEKKTITRIFNELKFFSKDFLEKKKYVKQSNETNYIDNSVYVCITNDIQYKYKPDILIPLLQLILRDIMEYYLYQYYVVHKFTVISINEINSFDLYHFVNNRIIDDLFYILSDILINYTKKYIRDIEFEKQEWYTNINVKYEVFNYYLKKKNLHLDDDIMERDF